MLRAQPVDPGPLDLTRRAWLRGCAAPALIAPLALSLAACGTPLPLAPPASPASPASPATLAASTAEAAEALRRLEASATAHGLAALRGITDINIAYGGQWRPLINGIQPQVVDAGYRGPSEERLLPWLGVNAQAYRGPRGRKQVFWRRGQPVSEVAVWYEGTASNDAPLRTAAAMVADIYGLFLLGPLWLATRGPLSEMTLQMSGSERVDGRLCDVVDVSLKPGFGFSSLDRLSLCIDRNGALVRRLRFTLEGFEGTRGAVALVDHLAYREYAGVLWPVRSYEEVVHPIRLPAHDWFVTGLDVNRGYGIEALRGAAFVGAAAAPAAAWL